MTIGFLLAAASITPGEERPCTIHASKTERKEELARRARVSEADARAAALAAVSAPAGKAAVQESELEVEDGCLVYSFDIRVSGEKGLREVEVDAGDGRVLKTERESEADEAKEKAKDDKEKEKKH